MVKWGCSRCGNLFVKKNEFADLLCVNEKRH